MPASQIAFSSAGATLRICLDQPATMNAAGFAALTFIEIGELTSIPSHGDTYNKIEHKPLSRRRVRKLKGTVDGGSFTASMAFAPGDAGQQALLASLGMDESVSFQEELQDGTLIHFLGMVMSKPHIIGTVDDITAAEAMIEVDSEEVIVYPA